MSLSSENIVVLYREGDTDSLAFAQAYQSLYVLDDDQLIPLPCSDNEVLVDYDTFQSEIETTLSDIILDPYYSRQVYAILIGYNVPGGFMDGIDVIATGSRLSRIGSAYSKQTGNPLFNQQVFQPYDASDSTIALITSRIDAPTLEIALNVLNNTDLFLRQGSARGTFFFDKYYIASSFDSQETGYENDLVSFQNTILPVLNMKVVQTVFWDEYTDLSIPQLSNDSFLWAWGANRAGYSYFEDSRTPRIFLYNADIDGAGTLRDANDKRFPMLALSSGYVCTAGAMSDPTADGYLRPTPFFSSLFRGTTIGEAFLFSVPFLDWTVALFGDPLITVKFPTGGVLNDGLDIDSGWDIMISDLANAIAYSDKRSIDFQSVTSILLPYTDSTKLDLFSAFINLAANEASIWTTPYSNIAYQLLNFPTGSTSLTVSPVQTYLQGRNVQVSALFDIVMNTPGFISSILTIPEGFWQVDQLIGGTGIVYTLYNFEMEVSFDSDFETILYSLSTIDSVDNWFYEKNIGDFEPFPILGVPSSYIGRRIRYAAPQSNYFDRCAVFYYRIRQLDDIGSVIVDWTIFNSIVSS